MNVALRPAWTRDEFFAWAEAQDERYEFDGVRPVAMTGGTLNHNLIAGQIFGLLRDRLRGSPCRPFIFDGGVNTVGDAIRYPDGVVTCSPFDGTARLIPDPVIVFEVISPTSDRMDRLIKPLEYAAVPSIRRYVIVESAMVGVTMLSRAAGEFSWTAAATAVENGRLPLPEIGIEFAVDDLYADMALPGPSGDT